MPNHRLSSYWSSSLQYPPPPLQPQLHPARTPCKVKLRKGAVDAGRTTAVAGIPTCPSSTLTLALPLTPERTIMRSSRPAKEVTKAIVRARECAWRRRNRRPCLPPATSSSPNSISRKMGRTAEDTALSPARPTAASKAQAPTAWAPPPSPAPRRPRRLHLPSTHPRPNLPIPRPPRPPQLKGRTARLQTAHPRGTAASSTRRTSWTSRACWPSRSAPRNCWSRTLPLIGRSPSYVSTPTSCARLPRSGRKSAKMEHKAWISLFRQCLSPAVTPS